MGTPEKEIELAIAKLIRENEPIIISNISNECGIGHLQLHPYLPEKYTNAWEDLGHEFLHYTKFHLLENYKLFAEYGVLKITFDWISGKENYLVSDTNMVETILDNIEKRSAESLYKIFKLKKG